MGKFNLNEYRKMEFQPRYNWELYTSSDYKYEIEILEYLNFCCMDVSLDYVTKILELNILIDTNTLNDLFSYITYIKNHKNFSMNIIWLDGENNRINQFWKCVGLDLVSGITKFSSRADISDFQDTILKFECSDIFIEERKIK